MAFVRVLTQERYVALVNAGGSQEDNWLQDAYSVTSYSTSSFTNAADLSGVTDPAPEEVYQTYRYATWGVGNVLSYSLPVPDGNYTIRLHFAEYYYTSTGARVFDVNLQGTTVQDNYDIVAAAGTRYKATTLEFSVVATGGAGIDLTLVNETYDPAILSAIELRATNPSGVADPLVDLELSTDTGSTWSSLATNQAMDRFGRGSLVWAAGPQTSGNTALVKVVAQDGTQPQDQSNDPFLIADNGPDYYVSPTGDNRNSGKSLADPMASPAALIAAYDLDPGDVLHVGAGVYTVLRNIVLSSEDSGVLIQGSTIADSILDRGNQSSGSCVFEMSGADDVTLESLVMRGAYHGVYAASGVDSDDLTVTLCTLYDHGNTGMYLLNTNDNARITLNEVYDSQYGIDLYYTTDTLIEGNAIHDNGNYGIYLYCDTSPVVRGNTLYNNEWGIYAYALSEAEIGDGNVVYANRGHGIYVYGGTTRIFGNEVFQNESYGIYLYGGTNVAEGNEVHGNTTGIYAYRDRVEGNRVYNNSDQGIYLYDDQASAYGNVVYSNSIGIQAQYLDSRGEIENNLVYANTNHGIWLGGVSGPQIVNNTVYQEVGDAVHIQDSSSGVSLRNNILWVEAGYDIFVAANSQTGLDSSHNLFHQGVDPNAHVGVWNGTVQDTLVDWYAASGQDFYTDNGDPADDESREGDPGFVDINGTDNILGYSTAGLGYDGGGDDNFYLSAGSPAIDRADWWVAPPGDMEGYARIDDPATPNLGSVGYVETSLGSSQFTASGSAKSWRSNDTYWTLTFPTGFTFPFYETSYASVTVSTEGFLKFSGSLVGGDGDNSLAKLQENRMIAPLWDNLRTNGTGDDIFVDDGTAGQLTIRWDATNEADGSDVNFAVTLFATGEIQFHYGSGNANLTPTVGISRGGNLKYLLSVYDGQSTLTDADSTEIAYSANAAYADMGAFEFRGSSGDTTPPTVVTTTPALIEAAGVITTPVDQIEIIFSEEMNPIDANSPAGYELRNAVDGIFGNGDDLVYTLTPSYAYNLGTGDSITTLELGLAPGEALTPGLYQLTIWSDIATSIHDIAGLALDGNRDGTEFPAYVRTFYIAQDFGDAPSPYPTLLAEDGARHVAIGPMLGTARDAELDGQPSTLADGDDTNGTADEDGIVGYSSFAPGMMDASVDLLVSADSYVNAWIDFNGNGTWDASEQVAMDLMLYAGTNHVTFAIPATAVPGATYARLRLTSYDTSGALLPTGLADDGEVEDYILEIDDAMYLYGTDDDDTIVVTPGVAGTSLHQVDINGTVSTYDPAVYSTIMIDALDGNDQITIHGTAGDESATLNAGSVEVAGPAGVYRVQADQVENVTVYGGGGNDSALLTGSDGDDTFVARESMASISSTGYLSTAEGFNSYEADLSTSGSAGADLAVFFDTAGKDFLTADPSLTSFDLSTGVQTQARGFDTVYVYASGGGDEAALSGSADQDYFYGRESESLLVGSGYQVRCYGFDLVEADGVSGSDTAYLYDSAGNDMFMASPASASLDYGYDGSTFASDLSVTAFGTIKGFATSGSDTASLLGSEGADYYYGYRNASYIGGSYSCAVYGFDRVEADLLSAGTGQTDSAYFYDTSGKDLFEAGPGQASILLATGEENSVANADRVYAFSTAGDDEAILTGSDNADTFYSRPASGYSYLRGAGDSYFSYAFGFSLVEADLETAGGAGADLALFYDTAGKDLLMADPSLTSFVLSTGVETRARGFEVVYVHTTGGGDEATLTGSDGNDYFYGREDESSLLGSSFFIRTFGFDLVEAYGVSGNDRAYYWDSTAVDSFAADPFAARMDYGTGKSISTTAFNRVFADFANDEDDVIDLTAADSAVNRYSGSAGSGLLTDDAAYWIYLTNLDAGDEVTATDPDNTEGNDLFEDLGIDYDFFRYFW